MTQGTTLLPNQRTTRIDDRPLRTVLIVDNDLRRRDTLGSTFREAGFRIHAVAEGDTALILAREAELDLVVLDVDLPDLSSSEVVRQIRLFSAVPIITVSTGRTEADRIRMLDLGADDVLSQPVSPVELMAHVRALLRRAALDDVAAARVIDFGDCELNLTSNVLRRHGIQVPLRPQERRLLEFLAVRPGRTFTREQILDAIWGGGSNITIRTVDVHVRWLREKIEDEPSRPRHLLTVRGAGYRFDLDPEGSEGTDGC